jgi:hypothetical protein
MYMRSEQRGVGRKLSAHASLVIGSSDMDLAVDLNATQTEGAIHRAVIIQVHDDVQLHRQANALDAASRPADERGSWCLPRAACPQ